MSAPDNKLPFADRPAARAIAFIVFAACVAALVYMHREDLFSAAKRAEPALNPDFVKCRDDQFAHLTTMRQSGVVNDDQFAKFRQRAEAFCADRFPPDAPAQSH